MFGIKKKSVIINAPAEIAGVRVRVSRRARRLGLRLDMKSGEIVLTWPPGASERAALRFIEQNRQWIDSRRAKLPPPRSFAAGETIFIHGIAYEIVSREGRGVTSLEGGQMIVYGRPEHLSRRIRDFLKEKARQVLTEVAAQKLAQINLKPAPLRVIDPKTRWGSCSPDGRMMFSWRLILTPPQVLDYVVAHEAAHRIEMNHSRKFWALCASLTEDAAAARKWLRAHGNAVMAWQ